ncbi:hypothetical protein RFI_33108, partial [Reticulomyxa filosa]
NKVQFQKGDCYMMIDLGAWTADMVYHEITGSFEVMEMIASFRRPWGSSYIDQDILKIFDEFFERNIILEIDGTNNIQIPSEFYNFTKNKIKELKVSISNCKYHNESGFDSVNIYIFLLFFLSSKILGIIANANMALKK